MRGLESHGRAERERTVEKTGRRGQSDTEFDGLAALAPGEQACTAEARSPDAAEKRVGRRVAAEDLL